jgi:hypothetical protein
MDSDEAPSLNELDHEDDDCDDDAVAMTPLKPVFVVAAFSMFPSKSMISPAFHSGFSPGLAAMS